MARDARGRDELVELGDGRADAARVGRAADRARPAAAGRAASPAAVAPGVPELGVMLPYAPLHHLLLADLRAAASRRSC